MTDRYDEVADTYALSRRADPRLAAAIRRAIGDASTLVNVGAGTGNYEPTDLDVIAVEPSRRMSDRRSQRRTRTIRARAEQLPLEDRSL